MASCYAGLGLTRSGSIPPSERDYLRKITTKKAHQMLTAGGKGELAHEEGGHGVFTKYLLEALDGDADRDEKGFVTFSDIASYVKPKVSRYTGTKQIPQYGSIDGEGEFVFVMAGLPATVQSDSSGLARERQRLAEDNKRLEADRSSLVAQRAQMEEQKRLAEEQRRLEEERQRLAEGQARLREEVAALERQNKEAQSQAAERRKVEAERQQLAMAKRSSVSTGGETGRDGRFIAYNNGTVSDTRTGLMWASKDNASNINWANAKSYCENYRGGGYSDWRMPTQDELAGLYDGAVTGKNGYKLTNLIELTSCCPWASETRGSEAALFIFGNGKRIWILQSYYNKGGRALPVRSGK